MNQATGDSSNYRPPSPSLLARLGHSVPFSVLLYLLIIGLIGYAAYSGSESISIRRIEDVFYPQLEIISDRGRFLK